jgi:hypothetical protein
MIEPSNGQAVTLHKSEAALSHTQDNGHLPTLEQRLEKPVGHPLRYTGETLLRTRPKIYRKIVALLADPDWSVEKISQACRVSDHTIRAVRLREASTIEERKKTLTSVLVDVATKAAEQMECKVPRGSLRDVTVAMGVSTDKVLALQGQTPVGIQIANIQMPTPEQDEARRRAHHALDEITRLLHKQEPLSEKEELMLKAQCRVLEITQDVD